MDKNARILIERLRDQDKWPGFRSVEHFQSLQDVAENSLKRESVDGFLAVTLIIHQLVEEILKLLIEEAEFFVQLKLYPYPFHQKKKKKLMFGQLISVVESSVWFQNKKYILEKSKRLNEIRIEIVHDLVKPTSLVDLKLRTEEAWGLYKSISFMALEAHNVFYSKYHEFSRDINWPPKDEVLLRDDGGIIS